MRILHVNHSDREGGAAIAARRLVMAQRQAGMDAQMLVLKKSGDEPWVHAFGAAGTRLRVRLTRAFAKRYASALAHSDKQAMRTLALLPTGLPAAIDVLKPDVVHWHWVGAEMVSLREMASVDAPATWTCHDEWAFCGAEHYSADEQFGCGYRARTGADPDRMVFQRKASVWANWQPHLICPSGWMREQSLKSELFAGAPRSVVANTIDTEVFSPRRQEEARSAFSLPSGGKMILFGAESGRSDPRKGFDLLVDALAKLPEAAKTGVFLAEFGGQHGRTDMFGMPVYSLGKISDQEELAKLYSAADLFVAPSRADNLPNTMVEAQSCGVPCVGFNVGGLGDIVTEADLGTLAPPFETAALAQAMAQTLSGDDCGRRGRIRRLAVERFAPSNIAEQHRTIYSSLLGDDLV